MEETLSDKIIFGGLADGDIDDDHAVIQRRVVKQFIKDLRFLLILDENQNKMLDKLAGDKLI